MSIRGDIEPWIIAALKRHAGKANVTAVAKYIWENYEKDIRAHPTALYTWQYDMRWAGQNLQKMGVMKKHRTHWELLP